MSLSSKTELARALFRSTPPESVTRTSGTATADSADGTVTVQLEDGDVIEVGTIGSVSAGDTVTIHVQRGEAQVIASEGWGDAMQAAVDEAQAIAEATGQHFWSDTNGAHVTQVTQEEWETTPTGPNALWNSLGMLLRNALTNLAAFAPGSVAFYDGNGNAASNITASFGNSGVQVGKAGESHLEMDYHSLRMIDKDGNVYMNVSDLRGDSGLATLKETRYGDGSTTTFITHHTFSELVSVLVDGVDATDTVTATNASITFPTAPANGATIVIQYNVANLCPAYTLGSRDANNDVAANSYVLGDGCTASDVFTLAEGLLTQANGYASHAEGDGSQANGYASHAQNVGTVAQGEAQTAIGKHNVPDSTSALVIGNGTGGSPSNAFTVDWSGNVEAAGTIEAKCGAVATSGVATASTGTTISAQEAVKWGGIAQVRLAFTRNSAITVLASGNISDFTAVTLASEYRPKVATAFACPADDAGPIFGTINTDGTVVVKYAESTGAQRTIASGTAFHVSATLVTG